MSRNDEEKEPSIGALLFFGLNATSDRAVMLDRAEVVRGRNMAEGLGSLSDGQDGLPKEFI